MGDGVKFSGVLELLDPCVEGISEWFDAGGAEVPIVGAGSEVIGSWCGMVIVGSLHDDEGFFVDEGPTEVAVMHVLDVEAQVFFSFSLSLIIFAKTLGFVALGSVLLLLFRALVVVVFFSVVTHLSSSIQPHGTCQSGQAISQQHSTLCRTQNRAGSCWQGTFFD